LSAPSRSLDGTRSRSNQALIATMILVAVGVAAAIAAFTTHHRHAVPRQHACVIYTLQVA